MEGRAPASLRLTRASQELRPPFAEAWAPYLSEPSRIPDPLLELKHR
jgi:hypothetical protein